MYAFYRCIGRLEPNTVFRLFRDMANPAWGKLFSPYRRLWMSCLQVSLIPPMPEMPEVETIARRLRKSIVGKRITEVRLSGLSLRKPVADTFAGELEGRVIRKIHRRGKFLIAELQPLSFWLIHLGMSGRIVYDRPEKWEIGRAHV